jgi:hypothetical protein
MLAAIIARTIVQGPMLAGDDQSNLSEGNDAAALEGAGWTTTRLAQPGPQAALVRLTARPYTFERAAELFAARPELAYVASRALEQDEQVGLVDGGRLGAGGRVASGGRVSRTATMT